MTKYVFLFFFVGGIFITRAQGVTGSFPVTPEDSIALKATWQKFVAAMDAKDLAALRSISLPVVHCGNCTMPEDTNFLPLDSFAKQWAGRGGKTLMDAIHSEYFRPFGIVQENYQPAHLHLPAGSDLHLYWLSFTSLNPGEISPKHEGANMVYQFLKKDNKFLFYGMFSVP